ncbi:hypothetical protein N836_29780 [Leptolyngbya sp. Heron Island J]|uniref:hypothetical protein n=1 Tax=Leptolyngbya sp. Heron Island J TaxID=1385935 RepID=UPI0003B9A7A5|nr:hypothetical protein [Leptolyngbya sp. Heron Island J]ESA38988.1 hypothetical protein N836_29780 [Leptolyngbya sp. Heron Island J]
MNEEDFIGPPTIWVVLTVLGGIATALGLIITLEYAIRRLSPKTGSATKLSLIVSVESHLEREFIRF